MFIERVRKARFMSAFFAAFFLFFTVGSSCFAQVDVSSASGASAVSGAADVEESAQEVLPRAGNITVNFRDVDILTVLNYLSEVSGVDIIPSPGVQGNVTMRLRDKPWEVALDIVTRNYGFAYSREGDIIRVMPKSMLQTEDTITEVIPLNHIIQEVELKKETVTTAAGESVTAEKKDQNISQVMTAITSMLDAGRGEKATFIVSANAVIVTAIPAKINSIKEMLKKIDKRPPQVMLEAKIIEIQLDKDEDLGIDWNVVISASGAKRPITAPFTNTGILTFLPSWQRWFMPIDHNGTAITGLNNFPIIDTGTAANRINPTDYTEDTNEDNIFSFGTLDFSQLTATLNMISARTDTDIISTPRITTLNNQKATIKVVDKVMLQKSQESIQTADIVTVEFEDEDEAREVGVKLAIVPHVNEDGDILVNLMPEVSDDLDFTELSVNDVNNTVAMSYSCREANTQIRVKDGETIFIGGLIKDEYIDETTKIPVIGDMFGDIPLLGKLFKYERKDHDKTEVVFFVTVHLVKDGFESIDKSYSNEVYDRYHVDYYNDVKSEYAVKKKLREEKKKVEVEDAKKKGWAKWFDFEWLKKKGESKSTN